MAADAVAAADTAGFDFSQGDGDGDGWVDLFVVIHSGFSESVSGNPTTCLWPRKWSISASTRQQRDNKYLNFFALTSAMRGLQSSSTGIMRIGTFVHELTHLFGVKDLYDVANATHVWTSTNGLACGFRDQTGDSETNAMTYQTAQYTLTSTSNISFKYLSQISSTYGQLRARLSKDGGQTWVTLGTYSGNVTTWTTVNFNSAALSAAGFVAGDVCQLRFETVLSMLWGWSAFPEYGCAIDDISLTGIVLDSTNWTTLSSNHTTTSYAITNKADASQWRYRVRAYDGTQWREWSQPRSVTVAYNQIQVTATDASALETGPETGTFTFTRTGSTLSPLTIFFTVSGTATAGSDHTTLPASLTFPAGQASATLTVTPLDDNVVEASTSETVTVTLSPAPPLTASALPRRRRSRSPTTILLPAHPWPTSPQVSFPTPRSPSPGATTSKQTPNTVSVARQMRT